MQHNNTSRVVPKRKATCDLGTIVKRIRRIEESARRSAANAQRIAEALRKVQEQLHDLTDGDGSTEEEEDDDLDLNEIPA